MGVVTLRTEAIVAGYGVLADGVLATRVAQFGAFVYVDAAAVRIAAVVFETGARVAADRVLADGIGAARVAQTLVHVLATDERIAGES